MGRGGSPKKIVNLEDEEEDEEGEEEKDSDKTYTEEETSMDMVQRC